MGKIYQSFLLECLDNGVDFACGTRYVSAEINEGKSRVKLEKNGKSSEIETKVLIGADGALSRVANDLNLDENKEWIVGCEEVYKCDSATVEPRLHCFLDAKLAPGYLAWIADDGEEIHVGIGGYAEKFNPREALRRFRDETAGKIVDLNAAELLETRGGRIPVGGVLRQIANEYGLLVGDAAGAVSPLTAGGLDPCLRLSKFAAEIVLKRLDTENPQILLDYSGELFRARFVSRLWMRRLIALSSNQTLLEIGFNLMRGKLGGKFARHVFFGRGSFPDVKIKAAKIENIQDAAIL